MLRSGSRPRKAGPAVTTLRPTCGRARTFEVHPHTIVRSPMTLDRRTFLEGSAAAAAALAWPRRGAPQSDLTPIFEQIEKRHDEAVARLQEWIRQPSIAAENRGMEERSEEHTSELQSRRDLVCRLLLEKKKRA